MDGNMEGSVGSSSHSEESFHFEPIYDAFICPLKKEIMHDPVSIENGLTFEREAIENWFKECWESGKKFVCPVTGNRLNTSNLKPSLALRNAIEEWSDRNEAAQLDRARRSLLGDSSETDILQGLKHIQHILENRYSNKHLGRVAELIPMIVEMLKNSSRRVRCTALVTLRIVAEEDDNNKEIIAEGDTVRTIVKFLSHKQSKEKDEAISLLYELSKFTIVSEKIGSVNGAILILVGMTNSSSENLSIVDKAERTLENLGNCESNVRQMAESGRLEPLLKLLLEGSPETKLSMAAYLGELVLSNDLKVLVARTVGSSLISILSSSDMQSREAALKALNQISCCEASDKLLIEAGILPPLVKDLFKVGPNQLPLRLKEVSATILANIVNSGYDFHIVPVGPGQRTLVSEGIIHQLLYLISNTGPTIECKLLQILVGLTSSASTVLNVAAAVKSSGAVVSLVQFIEAPQSELRLASIKLLRNLSPHMAEELADCLRGAAGQLVSLIRVVTERIGITEEQAAAVGLLADLPERDLGLTRQMLDAGAFQLVIGRLIGIQQKETRGNRFLTPYLEGLVKVLARVTFIVSDEPEAIALCREQNVVAIFAELLQSNGLDNVQMVSAMALGNLSQETKNLTELPEVPAKGFCGSLFSCFTKQPVISGGLCRIHCGRCSLRETFCILEGQAVERLVALIDHPNERVVEASLDALSTLLDDAVDTEAGVALLCEEEAVKPILNVLLEKRTDNLWKRAVWIVERLLRTEDIANEISDDANVCTALVDAFHRGDYRTRTIAERALKHVDKIPNFSAIFPSAG